MGAFHDANVWVPHGIDAERAVGVAAQQTERQTRQVDTHAVVGMRLLQCRLDLQGHDMEDIKQMVMMLIA